MSDVLHILILEDMPADAELVQFELTEAGLSFTAKLARDKTSYLKVLDELVPDLILSDYSLPAFDGLSAMKLAAEKYPEVPFIFVSGALGEEKAIELLKQGATDYVLKDRLSRLGPAVSRALQEAKSLKERKIAEEERKAAEEALAESEALYRNLFENASIGMFQFDPERSRLLRVNKALAKMFGYGSPEEMISGVTDPAVQIFVDPRKFYRAPAYFRRKEWFYAEQSYYRRGGDIMTGKISARRVLRQDGSLDYIEGIVEDITEQKRIEKELKKDIAKRKHAEESLKRSEQELRTKTKTLTEINTTMKVLLNNIGKDHDEVQERFAKNMKDQALHYLAKLKKTHLNENQMNLVNAAESYLHQIASPSGSGVKYREN